MNPIDPTSNEADEGFASDDDDDRDVAGVEMIDPDLADEVLELGENDAQPEGKL